MKAKGDNKLLSVGGNLHVGVQAYFKENATRGGLTKKDGRVFLQFKYNMSIVNAIFMKSRNSMKQMRGIVIIQFFLNLFTTFTS